MMTASESPEHILEYWYSKEVAKHWFASTPELDAEIKRRYEHTWKKASVGELDCWQENPKSCLAVLIVLDQFPLNMYRGKPQCFSTEPKAIAITYYALQNKYDEQLEKAMLSFLFMPLMHSENIDDQHESVRLFTKAALDSNLRYAKHHCQVINKFGRFPHRNAILGRKNTPDEIKYLNSKHAFKG